eukprot:577435-Lingulodinium_polyedra.AAC.1
MLNDAVESVVCGRTCSKIARVRTPCAARVECASARFQGTFCGGASIRHHCAACAKPCATMRS